MHLEQFGQLAALPGDIKRIKIMINDHLDTSDNALNLLKSIERLSLAPYDDQTGKPIRKWCKGATIGYGHLINRDDWEKYRLGISVEQALQMFHDRIAEFEQAVRKAIIVALSQHQFDALVMFAYNIGAPRFRTSSAVQLINDPRTVTPYVTLEAAWKAWNRSQGKISHGVINRRSCEWDIYSKGVYMAW